MCGANNLVEHTAKKTPVQALRAGTNRAQPIITAIKITPLK